MLVPGLLQIEDYARAIFRARFGMTGEEIDEQVAARLKRQEILARERPSALWVIVDEALLRRPVGGRCVMREQVKRRCGWPHRSGGGAVVGAGVVALGAGELGLGDGDGELAVLGAPNAESDTADEEQAASSKRDCSDKS